MATHSSILAWRIPKAEEPGGLQSMGSQSRTRLKQFGGGSVSSYQTGYSDNESLNAGPSLGM